MRCPKCGFHSFDTLEACKKCGQDLTEHRIKFGLGTVAFAGVTGGATTAAVAAREVVEEAPEQAPTPDFDFGLMEEEGAAAPEAESGSDFGFDFLSDEEPAETAAPAAPTDDLDFGAADVDADFSFSAEDDGIEELPAEDVLDEPPAEDLAEEGFGDVELDGLDMDDLVSFDDEPVAEGDQEDERPFDFPESHSPQEAPVVHVEAEADDLFADADAPPAFSTVGAAVVHAAESAPAADADAAVDDDGFVLEELPTEEADAGDDLLDDEAPGPRTLAKPGRRIVASLCDLLILAAVSLAFVLAGEMALGKQNLLPSLGRLYDVSAPYYLTIFCLTFGYFTALHYFFEGETLGKMLLRIRVEGLTGRPLSLSQAFIRSVGGLVALLPLGLGFLVILFDRQRRGWNDRLAGTRVVMRPLEVETGDA